MEVAQADRKELQEQEREQRGQQGQQGAAAAAEASKNSDERWGRLKAAVLSKGRRRDLLSHIPLLEVPLFHKQVEGARSVYVRPREELWSGQFTAVQIERPPLAEACASDTPKGVDNTGLLRLYPSEEVLAVHLLREQESLRGKSVIEIGAGFCGLAGLVLARNSNSPAEVVLSDGNEVCLALLAEHVAANKLDGSVSVEPLIWDRHAAYEGQRKFDVVVLSDCLYLNKIHPDLLNAIYHLMRDDGECLIVSPPRFQSMDFFVRQARERFEVECSTAPLAFVDLVRDDESRNFHPRLLRLRHQCAAAARSC